MIKHYVPRWVLANFGRLCAGNIFNGHTFTSNRKRTAASEDIWSVDLEMRVMNTHDGPAAAIFQRCIEGRRRISLDDGERHTLAAWLALFMARVPRVGDKFVRPTTAEVESATMEAMREARPEIIAMVKAAYPDIALEAAEALGQDDADRWLFDTQLERVRTGKLKAEFDAQDAYEGFLTRSLTDEWAKILCDMQWEWLRTNDRFIIGDNPLVRWHELSQSYDAGITRDVEVTFPFTPSLTLRMSRRRAQ